ncbi:NAD(P)/FAD-dependent oxidoreductase [Streptomyces sp. R39]|uniref:NAD(P)/FAD-dependent oxidoreductase n=1 Tax=Streptomyces sp. R39 TaxID=3238631 RepID=A0AB39QXN2_9ACTN
MTGSAPGAPSRVVIVGASAAGLAVAETLRGSGHTGTVTLVGEELRAPYDRPPLSKEILSGAWTADRLALRASADLDSLGLETRYGVTAVGLDTGARTVALSDGTEAAYDGLVIATGVRPRRLPGPPLTSCAPWTTRWPSRTASAPAALVVAGFLGAEAAAVAAAPGTRATLLEPAAVPLAHAVGNDVGRVLAEAHLHHGVDLRIGTKAGEVVPDGVRLDDGTVIEADTVLVAIGSRPNTEWLADSGLPLHDRLVCDEFSAAAPGVYGAGDVVRWHNPGFGVSMRIEHRTNATEQGMAAARNLLGAGHPFAPVPYFWSPGHGLDTEAYAVVVAV